MLTKDGSRTLKSERYGETYHSVNGALTEARHVFLDATGVTQRLKAGKPTHVLEIGFGLGLNTLLCADLAERHGANLEYHSFEHALVSAETLDELKYGQLLGNSQLADALGDFVAGLHEDRLHSCDLQSSDLQSPDFQSAGQHGIDQPENGPCRGNLHGNALPGARQHDNDSHTTHISRKIELTLHLQDVSKVDFKARFHHRFHAIFLDAFSPETNTECWNSQFIARLAQALSRDGKLSTYSAKGTVRRAMAAAGLKVTKLPGPPGKREMLVAQW